jgi:hypothetical protein
MRTAWGTAIVVLALAASAAEAVQSPPTLPPPGQPAVARTQTPDLPVSLERIRKAVAAQPALSLPSSGRKDLPRFYVEIVGTPAFDTFLEGFDLVNGPVPYGNMTHREFLSMVTPKELYSQAGFGAAEVLQAALFFKGVEWLARKGATTAIKAKRERDLNAIRGTIKLELTELAQLRAAARGVEALFWLAGCWQGGDADRVIEEQWMAPRGGTLIGMSRTVTGDRTSGYEHLQIQQRDGGLFYVARPSGQDETSFALVSDATQLSSEAVFENLEHDFPQRIIYRLQPDGSLLARIEGAKTGVIPGVEFRMKRTSCR